MLLIRNCSKIFLFIILFCSKNSFGMDCKKEQWEEIYNNNSYKLNNTINITENLKCEQEQAENIVKQAWSWAVTKRSSTLGMSQINQDIALNCPLKDFYEYKEKNSDNNTVFNQVRLVFKKYDLSGRNFKLIKVYPNSPSQTNPIKNTLTSPFDNTLLPFGGNFKIETPPNYISNKNLEVQIVETFKKIINGEKVSIDHIDMWGEGFLEDKNLTTGFKDSYNMNTFDKTVSNPPDEKRQIPNLIPLTNWNDFNIYNKIYEKPVIIPNKSVKTITLMGAPIIPKCAEEIGRMISDDGTIIIYGHDENKKDEKNQISDLEFELNKKEFYRVKNYELKDKFSKITIKPVIVYKKGKFNHNDL